MHTAGAQRSCLPAVVSRHTQVCRLVRVPLQIAEQSRRQSDCPSAQLSCRGAPAIVRASKTLDATESSPLDSDEVEVSVDPFGHVDDVMTEMGLRATTEEATVASITSKFESVSGLPVVDDSNNVVRGVITRKDIIAAKKKGLNLHTTLVQDIYSSPAVTVRPHAHISEAAGIMLAHKLHRLPVIDQAGRLVGIVSRTDVMQPILRRHSIYELAAPQKQEPISLDHHLAHIEREQGQWQLQYLFDGGCPVCRSFKQTLETQDKGKGKIMYVDIADESYDPALHGNISYEQAMKTIHAIRKDATVLQGPEAVRELYAAVGFGWASRLANLPVIGSIVDWTYDIVSKNRLGIGGVDAAIAARKLQDPHQGPKHFES